MCWYDIVSVNLQTGFDGEYRLSVLKNQHAAPGQLLKNQCQLEPHQFSNRFTMPCIQFRDMDLAGFKSLCHQVAKRILVQSAVKTGQDKTGHVIIHEDGSVTQVGYPAGWVLQRGNR